MINSNVANFKNTAALGRLLFSVHILLYLSVMANNCDTQKCSKFKKKQLR